MCLSFNMDWRILVFYPEIVDCPFVLFLLAIVLSVLRFTGSDYPFSFFNLFSIVLSVFRFTNSYYPFGIFKLFIPMPESLLNIQKKTKKNPKQLKQVQLTSNISCKQMGFSRYWVNENTIEKIRHHYFLLLILLFIFNYNFSQVMNFFNLVKAEIMLELFKNNIYFSVKLKYFSISMLYKIFVYNV